jgi:argininosuccinate lyase
MPGGYNRDLQDSKGLYMKGISVTRTTLRIMAKMVEGISIDEEKLRAGFIPGVFATDAALRQVAAGVPWREAYHDVRDHLERLAEEDCDAAVRAKSHEGATAGIDREFYRRRITAAAKSAKSRLAALERKCRALLK